MNNAHVNSTRSLWVSFLIGASLMAAIDEVIFHQILAWHHFYDRATPEIALMSDGLLHAGELMGLVAGFYLFADLRRDNAVASPWAWAGLFYGLGAFQLFDGIVNHKLLRLHQIRYVDNLIVYDLAWNFGAVILLLVGFFLHRRAKKTDSHMDTTH